MLHRVSGVSRSQRVADAVAVLAWAFALISSLGCLALARSAEATIKVEQRVIPVFFLLVLARLAAALVANRARRRPVSVLTIAIVSWAIGSTILNASGAAVVTHFPSPGDGFFLAAYVGLAGFLSMDGRNRYADVRGSWLEAIVLCGGTASLTGALMLQWLPKNDHDAGLAQLTALLYPVLDVVLLLVVITQITLGRRTDKVGALQLIFGFLSLTIADSAFMSNVSGSGVYHASAAFGLAWGVGFLLLGDAACRTPKEAPRTVETRTGPTPMLLASAAAILILVLKPSQDISGALIGAAVVTLAAAAARLFLALREANGAAEALALARTDDLTLLPNRRAVLRRVDSGITSGGPLALMLLDLDGFKEINDTLGHRAGDAVLQIAANRMRDCLPMNSLVARLGGDEFAVVAPADGEIELLEMARGVLEVISQPLTVDDIALSVSASIGITVREPQDQSSADLLRRADVAMYQAKQSKAGALLYDVQRDHFSRRKLQLAEDLRRGIAEGQLVLWYQPQIDAATQELDGVEALIRWQHPEHGLMSPIEFLPAARRAGLMLQVSEAVVAMAIADMKKWMKAGLDIRVAINCAPPELLNGMFLPRLFEACAQAKILPDRLVIEVTEESFLSEPDRARSILSEIREHNIQIAIDDYGTGFSSLSYLRDVPLNEL
ncbi:MAG: hypothetical protein JWO63_807, partial [Frankiales bacterium]|nr:hypothetical protein [Frankiales bacterium]